MHFNIDEATKLEVVQKILKDWFVTDEYDNNLWEFRRWNDAEWFDKEVLCYLLKENVIDCIDRKKLMYTQHFMNFASISSVQVQDTLKNLINSMRKQLYDEQCQWGKHGKLCDVLWLMMQEHKALNCQIYTQIFDYLVALVDIFEDEETFDRACDALSQFPFDKYQVLLLELIDSVEMAKFNSDEIRYDKHWNLCHVIVSALKYCVDALSGETCEKIFKFIVKLIAEYKDKDMIYQAFAVLTWFPFVKFQSSLLQLVEYFENNFINTNQHTLKRHEHLCDIVGRTLDDPFMLTDKTCNKLFDYLIKLIKTSDHQQPIDCAWRALAQFPFGKHQPLLLRLISLWKNHLNREPTSWDNHGQMCEVLEMTLEKCNVSLSQHILKLLFDYAMKLIETCVHEQTIDCAWKTLEIFPFDKYQCRPNEKYESSILKLINFSKYFQPDEHLKLCDLIYCVLKNRADLSSSKALGEIVHYFFKLFEHYGEEEIIKKVLLVLTLFPFHQFQSSLFMLIESMKNPLINEQCGWDKHGKLCVMIWFVLKKYKDSLNCQTNDQIMDYLMKLIERCGEYKTLHSALIALKETPFTKYRFLLEKYEPSLCKLFSYTNSKHLNLHELFDGVLKNCFDKLSQKTLNIIVKFLLRQFEHYPHDDEIISKVIELLILVPFEKYKFLLHDFEQKLQKFVCFYENQLNFELNEFERYEKFLKVIKFTLVSHQNLLSQPTIDQMFDFFAKLIERCDNENIISCSYDLLFKLFDATLLNTKKLTRAKSVKLCLVMKNVLDKCGDTLSHQTLGQIFDSLMKLIEQIDDRETIASALCVLAHVQLESDESKFNKYEQSLLKLIDLSRSQLNSPIQYDNHWNLCKVMGLALKHCGNTLSQIACDKIFEFTAQLIKLSKDPKLTDHAFSVLTWFPFIKYRSSLQQLVLLNTELLEFDKAWKWFKVMEKALNENSLSGPTRGLLLRYVIKLAGRCYEEKTNDCSWHEMHQQLHLMELKIFNFQSMDSVENEMNGDYNFVQFNMREHWKLCKVIEKLFKECTLSLQVCDRMFNYLVKLFERCDHDHVNIIDCICEALKQFPFDKFGASIFKLIDYLENKLNFKQWKHYKHWKLFHVIEGILSNCGDTFSDQIWNKLLDFFNTLIKKYPFTQYQSFMQLLVEAMKKQIDIPEQWEWDRHGKLCKVMCLLLGKYENLLNHQICDQIFNYLLQLIEQCDDEDTINWAWCALAQFPFDKYQVSLQHLIICMENKLNEEPDKHMIMCKIAEIFFKRCNKSSAHQTCERIFDYLMKLLKACGHDKTIASACSALNLFPHKIQSSMMKFYQLLLNNLQSSKLDWQVHQNWLKAMEISLMHDKLDLFDQNTIDIIFNYFLSILTRCTHTQIILSGIIVLEKLILRGLFRDHPIEVLKNKLLDFVCFSECPFVCGMPCDFNFDRYQVSWCAGWCVENVINTQCCEKKLKLIKLSHDRLESRNDGGGMSGKEFYGLNLKFYHSNGYHPVHSQFSVSSGVFYYEVTIVTNGEMTFGWSTFETILGEEHKIGHDKYSIGFDASRRCVVHNSEKITLPYLPDCQVGDVIGCLINWDEQMFVFYYKGQAIKCVVQSNNVSSGISELSYYATASLSHRQQCYFNFGQSPFKFPPKDILFSHFHKASGRDMTKYQLAETNAIVDGGYGWIYWFKHSAVGSKVDLFYRDSIQNQCDEMVKYVEENIRNERDIDEWRLGDGQIEEGFECVRYVQSIIEVMGQVGANDKVDVMAQWVGGVIIATIDRAIKAKLLELLYQQLQINPSQNEIKHRNICIILSHLIKYSQYSKYDFIMHIRKEVFDYLIRTFTEKMDNRTLYFALIALENLHLKADEKDILQQNNFLVSKLSIWSNSLKNKENLVDYLTSKQNSTISYQLHFTSEHFVNNVLKPPHFGTPNPAALNSNDRSEQVKLSSDLLSARSDDYWQSVRSECFTSLNVYYFEVILMTSGPMSIGWSTQRTNLTRTEVGRDKFSIGIDGYNKCVLHRDSRSQLRNSPARWKAGDVIGCLIELGKSDQNINKTPRIFSFTLNGQPISYAGRIFSSDLDYYASVSLSAHQQVYTNFGQSEFKFPPKKDFHDFHIFTRSRLSLNLPESGQSDFSNATIINSIIANRASMRITGDTKFNYSRPLSNYELVSQNMITTSLDNFRSMSSSIEKCTFCSEPIQVKLLRFVCCSSLMVCLACLSSLIACPKCSKEQMLNDNSTNGNRHLECRKCFLEAPPKLLQFVCCNQLIFCHSCLKRKRACPKCVPKRTTI